MTKITEHQFSKTKSGEDVRLFRMKNGVVTIDVITLGAAISAVWMPDRQGKNANICMGFSSALGYQAQTVYAGAVVGRYANRIAGAKFSLNEKEYILAKNNGRNHLHGGICGFDKKLWTGKIENGSVVMSLESPDGEEGYPGNLKVKVSYTLNEDNQLSVKYTAVSDQDTILNLTNHSYFNLNGRGNGDILRHYLKIYADKFVRCDKEMIPTGELVDVKGTPFDFREFHQIGERISDISSDLKSASGYDHNFVLNGRGFRKAAVLKEEYTGRQLSVSTDMPGIQLYSGNGLAIPAFSKKDAKFGNRSNVALETQFFPDTPNQADFPSCVLKSGAIYNSETVYHFSVLKDKN